MALVVVVVIVVVAAMWRNLIGGWLYREIGG